MIESAGAMQVLRIWLDPALHWKSHLNAVADKMKTQLQVLICLSVSIWGLPLAQAQMMYSMIIQSAMIYGVITWHQSQSQDGLNQGLNGALAPFQNQCLQIITEAYQAAPASTLEAKAHVSPLNLYLDSMMARAIQCLEDSEMAAKIEQACQEVH